MGGFWATDAACYTSVCQLRELSSPGHYLAALAVKEEAAAPGGLLGQSLSAWAEGL